MAALSAPLTADPLSGALNPALLVGLVLATAIVGGYTAHFFHVPRVIGFLLGGMVLRVILVKLVLAPQDPQVDGVLAEVIAPLNPIQGLALGVILFTIGGVFERSRMKAAGARVLTISRYEIALTVLLVVAGCGTAALWTQAQFAVADRLVFALLLGLAAIATAPAATLMVLQEYEAKGPITETIVGLTGLNNICCIVLFYATFFALASFGVVQAAPMLARHLWPALLMMTLGSALLGIICGTLLSILHARLSIAEALLVFLAVLIILGQGERVLLQRFGVSFNYLLTTLVIGAVFANLAIDARKLEATLRTVGAPLFAFFFVMAGFKLHLGDLAHMGWIGAVYVICRLVGKILGCRLGVGRARAPQRADGRLGGALVCQAAVVIGLAHFIEQNWQSPLAARFATVILGSVVVFELIGPLGVKRCAVLGGEVKAITLLRRSVDAEQRPSALSRTLRSLLRLLGLGTLLAERAGEDMAVQHIMRTNVELIPEAANFDEVLHFVEGSTHSHFPVVHEDGSLAGVIHFSDIREVIYDPSLSDLLTALDIADPNTAAVPMNLPLSELLNVFTNQNVAVLPVVERQDNKRVIGLVEQRDLLRALHRPR